VVRSQKLGVGLSFQATGNIMSHDLPVDRNPNVSAGDGKSSSGNRSSKWHRLTLPCYTQGLYEDDIMIQKAVWIRFIEHEPKQTVRCCHFEEETSLPSPEGTQHEFQIVVRKECPRCGSNSRHTRSLPHTSRNQDERTQMQSTSSPSLHRSKQKSHISTA